MAVLSPDGLLIGNQTIPEQKLKGSGTFPDSNDDILSEEVCVGGLVPKSQMHNFIPAEGAPYPGDGNCTALAFKSWDWECRGNGKVYLELCYSRKIHNFTFPDEVELPDDYCCDEETGMEATLPMHPNFCVDSAVLGALAGLGSGNTAQLRYFWDDSNGRIDFGDVKDGAGGLPPLALQLQGMSSYVVGSFQRRCVEYYTGTPPCLAGVVGTLQIPPGPCATGTLPGVEQWLVVSGNSCPPGANGTPYGVRNLVYLFSSHGWPQGIYF